MALYQFAISAGLVAFPTNVETIVTNPPHVMDANLLPLVGPVRQQTLSRSIQRNGAPHFAWTWDVISKTDFDRYVRTVYGGFTVGSVLASVVSLEEGGAGTGNYGWCYVNAECPRPGEHYTIAPGGTHLYNVVQNFYLDPVLGYGEFNSDFNFDFTI